jgi:hypothetical protein
LRLYDENKKIIKLKDDDNTDDLGIADINKSIDLIDKENYENISSEEDDDEEDINEEESEDGVETEEMEGDIDENMPLISNSQDILNNMILDIMKSLNPDDMNNKIEITIEMDDQSGVPSEADIDDFVKKSEINKEININYNNKIYFSPKKSGIYYLSVASDYYNQEGEFSLLVKEVEDIKFTSNKEIELNSKIMFKSKEKFKSKKFFISLNKDTEYELNGSKNLKFLVSFKDQKIISKNNLVKFVADHSGKYEVEVMALKKNTDGHFTIYCIGETKKDVNNIKIFSESLYKNLKLNEDDLDSECSDLSTSSPFKFNFKESNQILDVKLDDSYLNNLDKWYEETDVIKTRKIVLLDENDNEFELTIRDGKLEISPVKK